MKKKLKDIEVCHVYQDYIWRNFVPWINNLTVRKAIILSGFENLHPNWDYSAIGVGINGLLVNLDDFVFPYERIEIYKYLTKTPMKIRLSRLKEKKFS